MPTVGQYKKRRLSHGPESQVATRKTRVVVSGLHAVLGAATMVGNYTHCGALFWPAVVSWALLGLVQTNFQKIVRAVRREVEKRDAVLAREASKLEAWLWGRMAEVAHRLTAGTLSEEQIDTELKRIVLSVLTEIATTLFEDHPSWQTTLLVVDSSTESPHLRPLVRYRSGGGADGYVLAAESNATIPKGVAPGGKAWEVSQTLWIRDDLNAFEDLSEEERLKNRRREFEDKMDVDPAVFDSFSDRTKLDVRGIAAMAMKNATNQVRAVVAFDTTEEDGLAVLEHHALQRVLAVSGTVLASYCPSEP